MTWDAFCFARSKPPQYPGLFVKVWSTKTEIQPQELRRITRLGAIVALLKERWISRYSVRLCNPAAPSPAGAWIRTDRPIRPPLISRVPLCCWPPAGSEGRCSRISQMTTQARHTPSLSLSLHSSRLGVSGRICAHSAQFRACSKF